MCRAVCCCCGKHWARARAKRGKAMETSNNEQHPVIPTAKSSNQEPIQAPASLIPSVLRRLGQAVLLPGTAENQLTIALHDASWHVRATAVQALGNLGER